jgi:hypothetical protein
MKGVIREKIMFSEGISPLKGDWGVNNIYRIWASSGSRTWSFTHSMDILKRSR